MGYLDTKGLKKVLTKIKSEINDKINNISIPEQGQPVWSHDSRADSNIYLPAYTILELNATGENAVIYFDSNGNVTPNPHEEYKLRSKGIFLNYINWPSVFDMPWPNNEIPVFEEDKKYEIYIAGGRVASVSDITPLVEEVSYTITTKDQGYSRFNIMISGGILDFYEDGKFVYTGMSCPKSTTDKTSTFTYTVKGDLSEISHIDTQNLQYIKLDCSKMKSNNFHKVTKGLKIDEIIYPQACVGNIDEPTYDFEAPNLDFTFLEKNHITTPLFGNLISNKNLNKILNISNVYDPYDTNFENRSTPYTIGSYADGVNNFHYVSSDITHPKYVGYDIKYSCTVTIASEEFSAIIKTNEHITFFVTNSLFGYIETLYENISFERFTYGKIYYSHNNGFNTSLYPDIEFIQVDDFYNVPFKYAPYNIDDVKNFDENGNVID